jgi:succinylglutamic semialdehyde dehydrogenase
MHPSLLHPPANLIGGQWHALSGSAVQSRNPAQPGTVVWQGATPADHVALAVSAARRALPVWSKMGLDGRTSVLRRLQKIALQRADALAALISDEVGKVAWDAKAEAGLLAGKVDITLDSGAHGGMSRLTDFAMPLSPTRTGRCVFRPHGVAAVVGPFNFPMHLPHGHIVPALAMGNTVVFKPSDKAPACGQALAELFDEALREEGAPPGVLNLVQGGAGVARDLVSPTADIDAVYFTGSWPVGRAIMEANLDCPGRLLALEMGGNNAAVILGDADLRQAVVECVRSAFVGTGQRCTCTRRVIVHEAVAERVIPAICKAACSLVTGSARAGVPAFMGPLISEAAREQVLGQFASMARSGGRVLVEPSRVEPGWFVTPGILRVDAFGPVPSRGSGAASEEITAPDADVEVFGPVLRISTCDGLDDAISQANATRFGLAASIFTKDARAIDRFLCEARAGCVNVNTGTAGASSKLPFGGLGLSGNHRPAGSFSLDYCAFPVASMVESSGDAPMPTGMTFDGGWLQP